MCVRAAATDAATVTSNETYRLSKEPYINQCALWCPPARMFVHACKQAVTLSFIHSTYIHTYLHMEAEVEIFRK